MTTADKWEVVERLESLSHRSSSQLLAEHLSGAASEARHGFQPLPRWDDIPPRTYETYCNAANHTRVWRLLSYIELGDRVLDIGTGSGYVSVAMMETGRVAHYIGVDLYTKFADRTHAALNLHGIPPDSFETAQFDIYNIDRAWIAARRPSLVTVLEVLEHVPDVPGALGALASALDPDTSIVFTVPLWGRLEGVWGHASLFDAARVRRLCADAGLTVHHVEPIYNTWTLVVASRSPERPQRLGAALAEQPHVPIRTLRASTTRPGVELDESEPGYLFEAPDIALPATLDAGDDLAWTARPPRIVRASISFDRPAAISEVRLEGLDDAARVTAAWRLKPRKDRPAGAPATYVLRVGQDAGGFLPDGEPVVEPIRRLRLRAERRDGAPRSSMTVHRLSAVQRAS